MTGTAYPPARRLRRTETVAGHTVADPYRWLEDPGTEETRAWLEAQDELLGKHLAGLPLRPALAARIGELTRAGLVGPPTWRGERRFFLRRGLRSPVGGEPHVLDMRLFSGHSDAKLLNQW